MSNTIIDSKDEVIRLAKLYLKTNSFIDLTGFVHNDMNNPEPNGNSAYVRDIAYKMKESGEFEIEGKDNRWYLYKKPWKERHPFLYDLRLIVVTALITSLMAVLLNKMETREQYNKDLKQDNQIDTLRQKIDSI